MNLLKCSTFYVALENILKNCVFSKFVHTDYYFFIISLYMLLNILIWKGNSSQG